MSKILHAVQAMTEKPEHFGDALIGGNGSEVFFTYKGYKWSISKLPDGELMLFYYPGNASLEALASAEDYDWQGIQMVKFSEKELVDEMPQAHAIFDSLYSTVKGKVGGIDDVLDDILGGG